MEMIIGFMIIAVVIGFIIWGINTHTPIPDQIKQLILVVGVAFLVLYGIIMLLRLLNITPSFAI